MSVRSRRTTPTLAAGASVLLGLGLVVAPTTATAQPVAPTKDPVAVGGGGAVSSVDPYATEIGLQVLREGGNAIDAAVATAAALGVTEPYSAGIGGGGYFVVYDAASGRVQTLDGRETAPELMEEDAFLRDDGTPIPFAEAVTSGLSVGTPGTPATWQEALDRWGTIDLAEALAPAAALAREGFVVDETFRQQTADNAARFARFTSTRELFLPGGAPPAVGTVFTNPDLADTYDALATEGLDLLYGGALGAEVVGTVQAPPVVPGDPGVLSGLLELGDLEAYEVLDRRPTSVDYRGLEVVGMPPSSSGGSTVGEALNILQAAYDPERGAPAPTGDERTQVLHRYLESTALAFADRNRYVGDPRYVDVPLRRLLSQGFANERACLIDPSRALPKPVAPGTPDGSYERCEAAPTAVEAADQEGLSTTHLTTWDAAGNVVAYTLTIEATGGSGIVVPGRGFLLNNELTDFNFAPTQGAAPDPNLPEPGKRPRSSMSPTIVLEDGQPVLALGSPGGSTIITTVVQTLVNRIDLGLSLPDAVAAPRASQRNTAAVSAEPAFIAQDGPALQALGHAFTTTAEIGALTAIERQVDGNLLAAAEPVRRGGGDAGVVDPAP